MRDLGFVSVDADVSDGNLIDASDLDGGVDAGPTDTGTGDTGVGDAGVDAGPTSSLRVHLELAGDTLDSSGYQNDGTGVGALAYGPDRWNTTSEALTFDGSTSAVVFNQSSVFTGTDDLTVALWFQVLANPVLTDRRSYLFSFEGDQVSNDGVQFRALICPSGCIHDGSGYVRVKVGQVGCDYPTIGISSTSLTLGSWHQLVVVREGSTIRMYLDGTQAGTATPDNPGCVVNLQTSFPFILGGVRRGANLTAEYTLNGQLDDFRFYRAALSASEVAALYTPAPLPDPVVQLALDGNTLDTSGNGVDATVQGTVTYTADRGGGANGALLFDGSTTSAVFNDSSTFMGAADFTLMTWFREDAAPSQGDRRAYLFSMEGDASSNDGMQFRALTCPTNCNHDGSGYLRVKVTGLGPCDYPTIGVSAGTLTPGQWHHLAVVRWGSEVRVYLDGVFEGLGSPTPAGCVADLTTAFPFMLGGVRRGADFVTDYVFEGAMDEFRFYRGVLSDAEIAILAAP